jgi:hypothetical protein
MVGIPDGLGAFKRPADGRIVVSMNHEIGATQGIVRRHGQKGSFVSRLVVDPIDYSVRFGEDLNSVLYYWDPVGGVYTTTAPAGQNAALGRLCAASLARPGQLYNATTGNGTMEPIHFAGEETNAEGRAIGATANGVTRELPRLGKFAFENAVPAFNQTDRTVVASLADTAGGRLGVYLGTKKTGGGAFYNAGLTNGLLTNVKLNDVSVNTDAAFRTTYGTGTPTRFGLVDINWNQTGAAQQAEATVKGALALNRIEDGDWDPNNPNDFYFLTTDGGEGTGEGGGGGLWRMRFDDVENPRSGGTLELLLDGTELITMNKPDNMGIDQYGNLLIQEDPGNVDAVARILAYRISDGKIGTVAQFDPAQFDPAVAGGGLLTKDEESSGIMDMESMLGKGWFLFDAQVHTSAGLPAGTGLGTVEEYVQQGQLLSLKVTDWAKVYGP